jgi:hypothetical protein
MERDQNRIQGNRLWSRWVHSFFISYLELSHVVFPPAKNFDLLLAWQIASFDYVSRFFEQCAWIDQRFLNVNHRLFPRFNTTDKVPCQLLSVQAAHVVRLVWALKIPLEHRSVERQFKLEFLATIAPSTAAEQRVVNKTDFIGFWAELL